MKMWILNMAKEQKLLADVDQFSKENFFILVAIAQNKAGRWAQQA